MSKVLKVGQQDMERAKKIVEQVWQQTCKGPKDFDDYMAPRLARAIASERDACADIALAIDSGRGNEKEIANAIRARGLGGQAT